MEDCRDGRWARGGGFIYMKPEQLRHSPNKSLALNEVLSSPKISAISLHIELITNQRLVVIALETVVSGTNSDWVPPLPQVARKSSVPDLPSAFFFLFFPGASSR